MNIIVNRESKPELSADARQILATMQLNIFDGAFYANPDSIDKNRHRHWEACRELVAHGLATSDWVGETCVFKLTDRRNLIPVEPPFNDNQLFLEATEILYQLLQGEYEISVIENRASDGYGEAVFLIGNVKFTAFFKAGGFKYIEKVEFPIFDDEEYTRDNHTLICSSMFPDDVIRRVCEREQHKRLTEIFKQLLKCKT